MAIDGFVMCVDPECMACKQERVEGWGELRWRGQPIPMQVDPAMPRDTIYFMGPQQQAAQWQQQPAQLWNALQAGWERMQQPAQAQQTQRTAAEYRALYERQQAYNEMQNAYQARLYAYGTLPALNPFRTAVITDVNEDTTE